MNDRPDCYACQHRGPIPGDTHSECHHPGASLRRSVVFMGEVHGAPADADVVQVAFEAQPEFPAVTVAFQAEPARTGHATWPMSFDPKWLRVCSGWQAKPTPEVPDAP